MINKIEFKKKKERAYITSLTARLRRARRADSLDSGKSRTRSMEMSGPTESDSNRRHLWEVLVRRRISRAPSTLETTSSDWTRRSARRTADTADEEVVLSALKFVSVVTIAKAWAPSDEEELDEL